MLITVLEEWTGAAASRAETSLVLQHSNVITLTHTHTATDCHVEDRKCSLWDDVPLVAVLMPMVLIVTVEKGIVKRCPTQRLNENE